ncbi:hypothetical protein G7Y79_00009g025970 [Physcia stellaris]|nr:hypothetical protein G7Y79_00009g025970 [Physcia stellaris]
MDQLPPLLQDTIQFETENWANGSVIEDPFYKTSPDDANIEPGNALKVEHETDTTRYHLPPATAISRFVYQSEDYRGSRVPVSAMMLWPYSPKTLEDGYPIVAWAHGTSGTTPDSAPSNHKSVWQHFLAPYQLVSNGYVVVATDYAGLGVHRMPSGDFITHEYLASPSHANDVVYAVQAAQSIFSELSKRFLVLGHSQGGGAAWATAHRQAIKPVAGYLGAVAVSPVTTIVDQPEPFRSILALATCPGLASISNEFMINDVLTELGLQRLEFIEATGVGVAAALFMLRDENLLDPDWDQDIHLQKFHEEISNGGKEIAGPLLVIHGESDDRLSPAATARAVDKTAVDFPSSQLEYVSVPDVTHVPALQASQRLWMEWIADRFAGREAKQGVQRTVLERARGAGAYQKEQNWYVEAATQFYHAP